MAKKLTLEDKIRKILSYCEFIQDGNTAVGYMRQKKRSFVFYESKNTI